MVKDDFTSTGLSADGTATSSSAPACNGLCKAVSAAILSIAVALVCAGEQMSRKGDELSSLKNGDTKTITLPGGATMEMVYVAPGSFLMGSPESEKGRFGNETQHPVTLTKGYWIGKYEVTQRQWESVMGGNPSGFKGGNRPVEHVSWNDCQMFIRKVNAQLGPGTVRLPTEAEWEYACRAGGNGPYCRLADGREITGATLDRLAWFIANSESETHPVGQKEPNAFGLYDMLGNVWEWCADWYDKYEGKGTDPVGPASGSNRVLRGGNLDFDARFCRSALRYLNRPWKRLDNVGFRLCCPLEPRGDTEIGELVKGGAVLKTGDVKKITLPGGLKMEMVYVAPGSFLMGSPESEKGRFQIEAQHRVTLTKGYWLGKYEVTQGQWESVMGGNPSEFNDENRPVERVSWDDCQKFIRKVNGLLGYGAVRLPTEAEWEYACRADGKSSYCRLTGEDEVTEATLDKVAWYDTSREWGTHPVGQKKPNAFGFYDMHGNVWEWCADLAGEYDGDATDPAGPISGTFRVLRGGSWGYPARLCRSAFRLRCYNGRRDPYYGFRLAYSIRSRVEVKPTGRVTEGDSARERDRGKATVPTNPQTGDIKTITLPGGTTMEMVYIAPSSFPMGSPEFQEGQHRVTLTKGYWFGKYEVTQRQWESVMGENPSKFKGEDRPVEYVSWYDCQKFIQKVNEHLGNGGIRLPTEAEWEFACCANGEVPYCHLADGRKMTDYTLGMVAWYRGNSGYETHQVGQKEPNAFGIFDMHGNVLEWCADWYGKYNGEAIDPTGPASGSDRVLRGGCWDSNARDCRCADRRRFNPDYRDCRVGFRLCCTEEPRGETKPEGRMAEGVPARERDICKEEGGTSDSRNVRIKTIKLPSGATMEMVYVGPGSFLKERPRRMGYKNDKPQYRVTLTKGFWLGRYEVTQGQWESVMEGNPSRFKGKDRPVENVSWDDCQNFIQKVNAQLNNGVVRLPTEAEWEYACRAGGNGPFCRLADGREITDYTLGRVAWYITNSGAETHPAGEKEPNAFGLYDMLGNVSEWCEDWYGEPGGEAIDPTGPVSGSRRVMRGGCWFDKDNCRSEYRFGLEPSWRTLGFLCSFGFRLCYSEGSCEATKSVGRMAEASSRRNGQNPVRADAHGMVRLHNGGFKKSVSEHKKIQLWEDGPYWAETNVGAENPWDYGYYFWWGDTIGYKRVNDAWMASDGSSSRFSFHQKNTRTFNKSIPLLQEMGWLTADGDLNPEHDAAHVHWGDGWRLPTRQELIDLKRECDWTCVTNNGVEGYVVRGRGKYASASIFLPAAGYGDGIRLICLDSHGYYWSSITGLGWHPTTSTALYFTTSNLKLLTQAWRYYGLPVRPVCGEQRESVYYYSFLQNGRCPRSANTK